MWVVIFTIVLSPNIALGFDYGPVGNSLFWVVVFLWSMGVAHILLSRRGALWRGIAAFADLLLSPGVKPRRVRNPHIVVTEEDVEHARAVYEQPLYVHATSHAEPIVQPQPRHSPIETHNDTRVVPTRDSLSKVVHSTHMSQTAHPHTAAKVPTTSEPQTSHTTVHTKDTLTLEVQNGVPKLLLKRAKV